MRKICIALIVASLLVGGCSNDEDAIIGTYSGTMTLGEQDVKDSVAAGNETQAEAEAVTEVLNSVNPTLDIKSAGTYSMIFGSFVFPGTWKLDGDVLTLTPENPEADRIQYDVSGDYATLTARITKAKDTQVVFKRNKQ